MKLIVDTVGVEFQVSKPFEPRMDRDGVQRRDKQGGTGLPLHAVKLVAWVDGDAETLLVTVATDNPPELTARQSVRVDRLEAMPWVKDGKASVAFRAGAVVPLNGAKSPAPANSGKSSAS